MDCAKDGKANKFSAEFNSAKMPDQTSKKRLSPQTW